MPHVPSKSKEFARVDQILEKHALKKTQLRRQILIAFTQARKALTQADLIEAISKVDQGVDRVSIYRNLAHLKDAGVLHEVDSNNYIYCSHECEEHAHLLLFCQECHRHQEVKDHDRIERFMSALGDLRFFGKKQPIFLRGICTACG